MFKINVQVLRNPNLQEMPKYETDGAAAMDVRANIPTQVYVGAAERVLISTGLKVKLPVGWKINVLPRSGLAYKNGITVLNSPGLIDTDYTGDIGVVVINHGLDAFVINPGDRIAQIEIAPTYQIVWKEVDELGLTARGEKGFGSTGK